MRGRLFGKAINRAWHRFAETIAVDTEPHVWKTMSHGHARWHTYDPNTGSATDFASEDEVRIWLEERYYSH